MYIVNYIDYDLILSKVAKFNTYEEARAFAESCVFEACYDKAVVYDEKNNIKIFGCVRR